MKTLSKKAQKSAAFRSKLLEQLKTLGVTFHNNAETLKTNAELRTRIKKRKAFLVAEEKRHRQAAAASVKAAKKAVKDAEKQAKKEAADKVRAEKKAAADKIKAEKKAAADKIKAEKKAAADKIKAEKKAAADKIKAEKKQVADKLRAEKKALKDAEKQAKKVLADALRAKKKEEKQRELLETLTKEHRSLTTAPAPTKLAPLRKAIALLKREAKKAARKAAKETPKENVVISGPIQFAEHVVDIAETHEEGEKKLPYLQVVEHSSSPTFELNDLELEEEEEGAIPFNPTTGLCFNQFDQHHPPISTGYYAFGTVGEAPTSPEIYNAEGEHIGNWENDELNACADSDAETESEAED